MIWYLRLLLVWKQWIIIIKTMSLSCRYLLKHKVLCCLIQLVYILLNHHLIKGLCKHMYAGYLNPEKSGRTIRTWCSPDFVLVRAYSIGNGQPCLHACSRIYLFQQAKWNVPSQYTCIDQTNQKVSASYPIYLFLIRLILSYQKE